MIDTAVFLFFYGTNQSIALACMNTKIVVVGGVGFLYTNPEVQVPEWAPRILSVNCSMSYIRTEFVLKV